MWLSPANGVAGMNAERAANRPTVRNTQSSRPPMTVNAGTIICLLGIRCVVRDLIGWKITTECQKRSHSANSAARRNFAGICNNRTEAVELVIAERPLRKIGNSRRHTKDDFSFGINVNRDSSAVMRMECVSIAGVDAVLLVDRYRFKAVVRDSAEQTTQPLMFIFLLHIETTSIKAKYGRSALAGRDGAGGLFSDFPFLISDIARFAIILDNHLRIFRF